MTARREDLLARRAATLGPHSPLFYSEPLEIVRGEGVWLTDVSGRRFLDAYNNVPHVGHCHPRVVAALADQAAVLNVHTRYLHEGIVSYAEDLLATFTPGLERVFFVNSGSEANELALRLARQRTRATGVLVSDWNYHGNTTSIAQLSTGLAVDEPLGEHVRAVRVPDLDDAGTVPAQALGQGLRAVDEAIASLQEQGHGLSAFLFDPLFTNEGIPTVPAEWVQAVCRRVQDAGGLVIADEVQTGFGRTGPELWGHRHVGVQPDLVTMGKPMGNGYPMGAVVTTAELLEDFGSRNLYFNTFAGTPVAAAVGAAVLQVMADEDLPGRAARVGARIRQRLVELASEQPGLGAVKGAGLFLGVSLVDPDDPTRSDPEAARRVVESVLAGGVLISRIGRDGNVLKVRPPLTFDDEHADLLLDRLEQAISRP